MAFHGLMTPFFSVLNNIPLSGYITICPLTSWRTSRAFHVWVIMKEATLNIHVPDFVWTEAFSCFGKIPWSMIAGSCGKSVWFCEKPLDCLPEWLCMDGPRRRNSALSHPKNPEVNAPCSVNEGIWGKLLAMTQCTRVVEILKRVISNPHGTGKQRANVSFHPRDILLLEKEPPELFVYSGKGPQDMVYLGRAWPYWALPSFGSLSPKPLALSLDNSECLLNLPLYPGGAAGKWVCFMAFIPISRPL